jgi:hypothetical protein
MQHQLKLRSSAPRQFFFGCLRILRHDFFTANDSLRVSAFPDEIVLVHNDATSIFQSHLSSEERLSMLKNS